LGGSLFTGLNIALSGLEAQQSVLAVTSHNIANASTPGYSLQEADLAPNPPYSPPAVQQGNGPEQFGMGVTVASVQRVTSQFLTRQLWDTQSQLGGSSEQSTALGQVQSMLNEPSSTGLNSTLDAFWNAWQNLGNDAQSTAARSQVVAAGQALTSQFNTLSGQITGLQSSLDATVGQDVGQVNQMTAQIATLNQQIGAATAAGQNPNDLMDSRDTLIGKLAKLMPVSVTWQSNGEADVAVGTTQVVGGPNATSLVATPNPANHNFLGLTWSIGNIPATISGGSLGAVLTMRDTTLPGYLSQLDALASGIATQVNTVQAAGFDASGSPATSDPFFTSTSGPITAASITVNPSVVGNPSLLAAASSASAGPGDGSNAVKIADLQNSAFLGGGTQTPTDAYSALVGQVGSDVQAANNAQANQQALQQSIQNQQQQVSGVSLNEEMTTMVEAQNAYAAAAKVASTIDTMLGSLIAMVP